MAFEEVTLPLLKTKCVPVLLYGLEALPLNKSQIASIDFVINRFFMKLFNTNNIEIVKCCHQEFCFSLPSIALAHRAEIFFQSKLDSVIIFLAKDSCVCKILYFVTLSANRLSMYFSSHASLLVYLIAYAFGLLCFICCFLVKLYILFNRLI